MRLLSGFSGLLLGFALIGSYAQAAIIVTVASGNTFNADSGVHQVDILARSNAADSTDFLIVRLNVPGVTLSDPAGTYDGPGFLGNGNIFGPGSSFPGGGNDAALSIEYSVSQLFPATNALIARLNIDTTGLAPGVYNINVTRVQSLVGDDLANAVSGSFTINAAAVPEPVSMITTSLGLTGVWAFLRRKKLLSAV